MKVKLILVFVFFCSILQAQHVAFGEKHPKDSPNSIYFDKDGMMYPDIVIPDSALKACNYSLKNWYVANQSITDSLLDRFKIPYENNGTVTIYRGLLEPLNDSLIREKALFYDEVSKNRGLEFYIHGFRKSYHENEVDVTSVTEFGLLTSALLTNGKRENVVVRVYWDGMYDCCFSADRKRNTELFKLFETANENAIHVGTSFGKFMSYFEQPVINIVAHSLGSQVVVQSIQTTQNRVSKFKIALIAPAIAGQTIQSIYEKNKSFPNCSWMIVYNENDFVLKKKDNKIGVFGPGAYKYGVTTLGCNKKNDATNLYKWMASNQASVPFFLVDKSSMKKAHSLRVYAKNQNLMEVSNFLEGL